MNKQETFFARNFVEVKKNYQNLRHKTGQEICFDDGIEKLRKLWEQNCLTIIFINLKFSISCTFRYQNCETKKHYMRDTATGLEFVPE